MLEAARDRGAALDAAALAKLWLEAMQGALILWKASREDDVVSKTLRHVRGYLLSLL